jgi:hypothetical protein
LTRGQEWVVHRFRWKHNVSLSVIATPAEYPVAGHRPVPCARRPAPSRCPRGCLSSVPGKVLARRPGKHSSPKYSRASDLWEHSLSHNEWRHAPRRYLQLQCRTRHHGNVRAIPASKLDRLEHACYTELQWQEACNSCIETRTTEATASPGGPSAAGAAPILNRKNEKNKFRYTRPLGWRNDLVSELVDQGPRDPDCHPLVAMAGPQEFPPKSIHRPRMPFLDSPARCGIIRNGRLVFTVRFPRTCSFARSVTKICQECR